MIKNTNGNFKGLESYLMQNLDTNNSKPNIDNLCLDNDALYRQILGYLKAAYCTHKILNNGLPIEDQEEYFYELVGVVMADIREELEENKNPL